MTASTFDPRELLHPLYDYLVGGKSDQLDSAARFIVYAACDGFGDTSYGESREWLRGYVRHGYDWSHVRDSSDTAILQAAILLQELVNERG